LLKTHIQEHFRQTATGLQTVYKIQAGEFDNFNYATMIYCLKSLFQMALIEVMNSKTATKPNTLSITGMFKLQISKK